MTSVRASSIAGLRRALVLIALLGGLFAMHGLADHGTTHGGQSTASHADHPLPSSLIPTTDSSAPGHPDAGLCLALLLAGLAMLFAWWRSLQVTTYDGQRLLALRTWSPIRARAPDPPDLTRLGLCRC